MSKLNEALEKIEGVVSKIGVSVSRKFSDGAYGSAEVSMWAEMDLSPTADAAESYKILDDALTAEVGRSAKEKKDKIQSSASATVPMVPLAPSGGEGHCAIHNTQMKKYTKDDRSWYSHRVSGVPDSAPNSEKWCKGV